MAKKQTKEEYNEYMRKNHVKRYRRIKGEAILKLGGKCVKCSKVDNLQFDHIDPKTKKMEIAEAYSRSAEVFWKEVAKCQLLCRGCHADKTTIEKGFKIARGTHGTLSSYRYCKCDLCKKAKSDWMKKYKKDKKEKK